MFTATYWWFGLIGVVVFGGVCALVWALRDRPRVSYAVAYSIALFLLLYKIAEYIAYQAMGQHIRVPLEFSALSYFIFAITVVFRTKKADSFGCFVAILAGLMFSVSTWVAPDTHIANRDIIFLFVMSMVNHHLLLLGGALMAFNVRRFDLRYWWLFPVGVGAMVGYSWLLYSVTNYAELYGKPIIISITDGSVLLNLTHAERILPWQLGLWIPGALLLLALLIVGYLFLNRALANRRARKGVLEDYRPSLRGTYRVK